MAEEVGGTWLFSEAVTEGRGNLYRSLSTNLPKEIMQYYSRLLALPPAPKFYPTIDA